MWLLGAFVASWAACFAVGFLGGLYVNRGSRRVPDHPVLRGRSPYAPERPRLQVIEGGRVYDWARDA